MTEARRFPATFGPWKFSANDVAGQLTLTDDGNGNLSGKIDEQQQVLGFWDANLGRVTFLRILDSTNPSSVEVYTGYFSSHVVPPRVFVFTLAGSYQAFSGAGVTPEQNVFEWNASASLLAP